MDCIAAFRAAQDGKRIRRKVWPKSDYLVNLHGYLYLVDKDCPELSITIDEPWCSAYISDLLSTDWESVEC